MRRCFAVLLAAVAAAVHMVSAQQRPDGAAADKPPTFRSRVESVRLDVMVTDEDGEPVTDLVAGDFSIHESGMAQAIQQFARVALPSPRPAPLRGAAVRPVSIVPDVSHNDEAQERIYVIVMGALSWAEAARTTKLVQRFLDGYFGERDLAALIALDDPGVMRFTAHEYPGERFRHEQREGRGRGPYRLS